MLKSVGLLVAGREKTDDRDTTTFPLKFFVFQILCSVLCDCILTLRATVVPVAASPAPQ